MKYLPYEEYVNTDIDWLKQTPSHWQVLKGKFIGQIATTPSLTDEELTSEETSLCYIKVSELNVNGNTPLFSKGSLFAIDESISHTKNSIIFPKRGEAIFTNKASILKFGALLDPNLMSWELESHNDLKFFYYALLARRLDDIADTSTVPQINNKHIMPMFFPYPEPPEQRKIGIFLDYKTQKIDQLIKKKKELIEKLEEQRIAVITQAVTKGIDENAKLKPSGVDWLGDVPEHWDVKRLRFSINSNPVKSEVANYDDDTLVSFVPMDSVSEYGGMDVSQEKPIGEVYSGYTYFQEKDVVIAKITPCFENGKGSLVPALTNDIGFGTTEFHVLRALCNINSEYLFFLTISDPFRVIGASEMLGAGGQKRIPENFVKDFRFGLPPIEEQHYIVLFLKEKLAKLDAMKNANFSAIEKLEEYRSAIMTSAVTGKIDVRTIEIPKEVV